jgi:hypothetical protein
MLLAGTHKATEMRWTRFEPRPNWPVEFFWLVLISLHRKPEFTMAGLFQLSNPRTVHEDLDEWRTALLR